MKDGVLIVDKPQGCTSFDVVAAVRRLCGQRKVGHTGTLDPMATGVLPILLGRATRAASLIPDTDKAYRARFRLGVATDTQDCTGTVYRQWDKTVSRAEIEAVIPQFLGEIRQVPPMYSAVRKDGKRLYELARQGVTVEREARPVTIYRCALEGYDEENQEGTLAVSCSKGTYIRTLCADLGEALGTGAILTALRRTAACGFSLENALPLEEARRIVAGGGSLEPYVLPVERLFSHLEAVSVSAPQARRFGNGGSLALSRTGISRDKWEEGRAFRVLDPEGRFLGLGQAALGGEEPSLKILRVFKGGEE